MVVTWNLRDMVAEIGDTHEFGEAMVAAAVKKGREMYPENEAWATSYALGVLEAEIGHLLWKVARAVQREV